MSGVQFFPQVLDPGTVVGRLALDPGPAEQITIARLFAAFAAGSTTFTTANTYNVTATDRVVVSNNKTVAAATTIQLPSVYVRNGKALDYFDLGGNAGPITFLPFGSETINGNASWQIGSGKSLHLVPLPGVPGWAVGVPDTAGGKGVALLDFGASPGAADTSLVITGQTNIVAGSYINVNVPALASTDHTADEHWVDAPYVFAGNIVPGVGFTIYARSRESGMAGIAPFGKWNVNWKWE